MQGQGVMAHGIVRATVASGVLRRISDRVYRLEDRFVNLYVIDVGKVALVDTGTRWAEPLVRQGLKELGKEVEDIGFILLTHHHLDHVGTAGVWKREARAQVGVHEKDAPVVAGDERRKGKGVGVRGKTMVLFANLFGRALAADPVPVDRTFGDRETLDILGLRVETIYAPGHTLGSCAFYLTSDHILFAGDAVNARRGKPEPPVFIEDAEAAKDSFRKLVAMEVAVLCPGHGTPIPRGPS